jgi:hypothetical protein
MKQIGFRPRQISNERGCAERVYFDAEKPTVEIKRKKGL